MYHIFLGLNFLWLESNGVEMFWAGRLVGLECGETVSLWNSKFVLLEGCWDELFYNLKVLGMNNFGDGRF